MPFNRLLLIAASTKKYIIGNHSQDKVELKLKEDTRSQASSHSSELALFFQIDNTEIRRGLDMLRDGVKCCDGLIFYVRDGQAEKVICLVEMKSINTGEAAAQIGETRKHLKTMLENERCGEYLHHVVWKACIYSGHPFLDEIEKIKRELINTYGFKKENIAFLNMQNNDIGPLLRGEMSVERTKPSRKSKHR